MNIQYCEQCGKETEHDINACTQCGRLFSIDELIADNKRKAEIISHLEHALTTTEFIIDSIVRPSYYTNQSVN